MPTLKTTPNNGQIAADADQAENSKEDQNGSTNRAGSASDAPFLLARYLAALKHAIRKKDREGAKNAIDTASQAGLANSVIYNTYMMFLIELLKVEDEGVKKDLLEEMNRIYEEAIKNNQANLYTQALFKNAGPVCRTSQNDLDLLSLHFNPSTTSIEKAFHSTDPDPHKQRNKFRYSQ